MSLRNFAISNLGNVERQKLPEYTATKVTALVVLATVPFFISGFQTRLATEILILALFAASYDLLIGYSGLLSFGHALPFGVGGYVLAFFITDAPVPLLPTELGGLWLGMISAMLIIAVIMLFTGALSLRTSGIYFALLTLAFAQLVYVWVLQSTDITGGENGIIMIVPPVLGFNITDPTILYYLTAVAFVVSYLIMRRIVSSPYGLVLRATMENKQRAKFLGHSVFRYQLVIYVVSGIFAGIAGLLFGLQQGIMSPTTLFWETTTDPVLATIIGGMGTLWGPVVGAVFLFGLREVFSGQLLTVWPLLMGVVFVLVVLTLPKGLAGLITSEDPVKQQLLTIAKKLRP